MPPTRDEIAECFDRINRLGDRVFALEAAMGKLEVRGGVMVEQLRHLSETTATREQLDNLCETVDLKNQNLLNVLEPIKKSVYWAIGLIVGSVFVAILALVIKN